MAKAGYKKEVIWAYSWFIMAEKRQWVGGSHPKLQAGSRKSILAMEWALETS